MQVKRRSAQNGAGIIALRLLFISPLIPIEATYSLASLR